jgi:predicted ATPase
MPSTALDSITIRGFKSIALIDELQLGPINVLIGSNGSGKSNFIGVFSFLHAVREGRLADYVARSGGAEKVLHFGSKTTSQVYFHLSFREAVNQYDLRLDPSNDDGLIPFVETVSFWDKKYPGPYSDHLLPREGGREAGISNPNVIKIASWVRSRLDGWRIYHVHDTSSSSPMRKTAKVNDNQFLRADGANLASFLYFLREMHETHYDVIRRTIQRVAPFFEDFRLAPLRLSPEDITLEWRHVGSDQYFGASSLSDGTLRFVVLATLFLQPTSLLPSTIIVDEPELGLHPYAIGALASLIRQASKKTQVIVSTQSSLLLDYFDPADVLVADRVDGGTRISRLDPSKLGNWLSEYSLGQLWEKNEISGRPGSESQ